MTPLWQEWGSPNSLVSSGVLAVSSALAESHVSLAIDGTEIQTSVTLKKNKVWEVCRDRLVLL